MKKIMIMAVLVGMFGAVGAVEYEAPVENQVWDVKCTDRIVSYASPQRISLREEIRMCR